MMSLQIMMSKVLSCSYDQHRQNKMLVNREAISNPPRDLCGKPPSTPCPRHTCGASVSDFEREPEIDYSLLLPFLKSSVKHIDLLIIRGTQPLLLPQILQRAGWSSLLRQDTMKHDCILVF